MVKLFIPVILGTARKGRESEKVARFILEEVKKYNLDSEFVDVGDFRIEATDNSGWHIKLNKFNQIDNNGFGSFSKRKLMVF